MRIVPHNTLISSPIGAILIIFWGSTDSMADASDGLSPDLAGSVTANYNDPHSDSNRVGILDLILVIPSVAS